MLIILLHSNKFNGLCDGEWAEEFGHVLVAILL